MNKNLPKSFLRYSDALCEQTEFKRYGYTNSFVDNDTLCSFNLKRWSNNAFTLEFGMRPLCGFIHGVEASDFVIDRLTYDQMVNAITIDELSPYVTEIIIPFFKQRYNSLSALSATVSMIQRMNDARLGYLRRHNIADRGLPIEKQIYLNDNVFFFAMKSLSFSFIERLLPCKIDSCKEKIGILEQEYQKDMLLGQRKSSIIDLNKRERAVNKLNYLKTVQKCAEKKDRDFFIQEISKREESAKMNLPPNIFV